MLSHVYVSQMTFNGIEGHLNGLTCQHSPLMDLQMKNGLHQPNLRAMDLPMLIPSY